mgnify:CR=1 FL=1
MSGKLITTGVIVAGLQDNGTIIIDLERRAFIDVLEDFMLSKRRNKTAATKFFERAL